MKTKHLLSPPASILSALGVSSIKHLLESTIVIHIEGVQEGGLSFAFKAESISWSDNWLTVAIPELEIHPGKDDKLKSDLKAAVDFAEVWIDQLEYFDSWWVATLYWNDLEGHTTVGEIRESLSVRIEA